MSYAAATGDAPSPPREDHDDLARRVERLRRRGRFGLGAIGAILRLPLELLGILGVIEFYSHRPAPLEGSENPAAPPSPWPDECVHHFSRGETQALRAAAREQGATLNDLLVRDMFLACGQWVAQYDPRADGRHVRVMVPVNLRTRRDADLSAANVVAMINLDRRPLRWKNLSRMLRVLHWEMSAVKRARLGLTFIRGIQVVHYCFRGLRRLMPADKCLATCVLSNLGDPWRDSPLANGDGVVTTGEVTVKRLELLPPIRPLTRAAFGLVTLGGELIVSLHYDRRHFTRADGDRLLSMYVERLKRSAE